MAELFQQQYSDEQIEEAIEQVSTGSTLKAACLELGIGEHAARKRIIRDERLGQLYARARESYADVMAEKLNDIADEETDQQRARLKCDNVKWYAARVLPKKYGDRKIIAGDEDQPVRHEVSLNGLSSDALRAVRDAARTLARQRTE